MRLASQSVADDLPTTSLAILGQGVGLGDRWGPFRLRLRLLVDVVRLSLGFDWFSVGFPCFPFRFVLGCPSCSLVFLVALRVFYALFCLRLEKT